MNHRPSLSGSIGKSVKRFSFFFLCFSFPLSVVFISKNQKKSNPGRPGEIFFGRPLRRKHIAIFFGLSHISFAFSRRNSFVQNCVKISTKFSIFCCRRTNFYHRQSGYFFGNLREIFPNWYFSIHDKLKN